MKICDRVSSNIADVLLSVFSRGPNRAPRLRFVVETQLTLFMSEGVGY